MNAPHQYPGCRMKPKQRIIIGILMLGTLMGSLHATIVILAFPTTGSEIKPKTGSWNATGVPEW
jgi:hypothetical protein